MTRAASRARIASLLRGCLIALISLIPGIVLASTSVSGVIAAHTTWSAEQSPYIVTSDIVIQNGARLTIEPGVTVYMEAGTELTVQSGAVRAVATAANRITVTSARIGLGQAPAPGDWKQWVFGLGATGTHMEYVTLEYGKGLAINGASPVLNHLILRHHDGPAIAVDLAASPTGIGNQAIDNKENAVLVPAGDISGTVTWGLKGIPYHVASGTVSVGASPEVVTVTPDTIAAGQSATLTLSGTRLAGATQAAFEGEGLTASLVPGATATEVELDVSAAADAAGGKRSLNLLVDAGEIRIVDAVTVVTSEPWLTSVTPGTVYLGQGDTRVLVSGANLASDSQALLDGEEIATSYESSTALEALVPNQSAAGTRWLKLRTPDPANPGQYLISNALPLAVSVPPLSLAPAEATLVSGTAAELTLGLPFPAPPGGLSVNLVSSVPTVATVPASVTVPAGASTAAVPVTAGAVGITTLTASKSGFAAAASKLAVVPQPTLTLSPANLVVGIGRSAQLTLTSATAAPSGGLTVALASSDPGVASVPGTVTIPVGSTSASVLVRGHAQGSATLSALADGQTSSTSIVTVRGVSLDLPSAIVVPPGGSQPVSVTLSDPAPAGGLSVTLASSNPPVASVPASITVPAGATTASFTVSGGAAGSATLTASAAGYESATAAVTVDTLAIGFEAASLSVPVDMTHLYSVTLSRAAPAGGLTVSLAVANPALATVSPATLTIPEGQTSGGVVKAAVRGVATGSTSLVASAAGVTGASAPLTITGKPEIRFYRTSSVVGKGMRTYYNELMVELRSDGANYAPPQPFAITLTASDPGKLGVPASVTVPPGSFRVAFDVIGIEPAEAAVIVDASAPGCTSPAAKLQMSVVHPTLTISSLDGNRATDSVRDNFYVSLSVPGAAYSSSQTAVADIPIDVAVVDVNPAGVVSGIYDAASGGNAVSEIFVRAGKDSTYASPEYAYAYVDRPAAAGTYRVRASIAGGASVLSAVQTVGQQELKFSRAATMVGTAMRTFSAEVHVQRTVNGQSYSGPDPLTVALASSEPGRASVPETVTIPGGSSSASVIVTGIEAGPTPVTIDAAAPGYASPATKLAVNVVHPTLTLYSLDTQRSTAAARDNFSVGLSVPGAAYPWNQVAAVDIPIDVAIVDASPAGIIPGIYNAATAGSVITQMTVRAGRDSTYASPDYTYGYVDRPVATGTYRVQVSIAGGNTALSAVQTVSGAQLTFSRTAVTAGIGMQTSPSEASIQQRVNGQLFNGAEPVVVTLTSLDPSKASVPATVTIPAGSSSTSVHVTGVQLTDGVPVAIDAAAAGYESPATKLSASVVAPSLTFSGLDVNRSQASPRDNFSVYATVPGSSYGQKAASDIPIQLAIIEADPPGLVDGFHSAATGGTPINEVVMRAGQSSSDTAYVGVPALPGTYRVQALASGFGTQATSAAVTVDTPGLIFSKPSVVVGKGFRTWSNEVSIRRAVNGSPFSGPEPLTVNLSCSASAVCKVPATVTIPAGQSSAVVLIEGTGLGTTTVTASATGYQSAPDLNVTGVIPQLTFSGPADVRVGQTTTFRVYVSVPGATYSQTAVSPITVDVTGSAPDVASAPATATIPAGDSYTPSLGFTGLSPGTITLTVSGNDLQTASKGPITVSP